MGKHKGLFCVFCLLSILVLLPGASARAISFESYTLDNGMEIMLGQSHSSAMVAAIITINAGSYLEKASQNGVSHMLEHLLFDGTARSSRGELSEEMREIGGYFNAFTRKDYTTFLFLVPSDQIEKAMEIQADMLLHSILPEGEVAKERKVVSEEINKNNSTIDYRREKYADRIFYAGTPYARPVLGGKNVIASVTRGEIIDYYRKLYVPSNMRAMIVGDFDRDHIEDLLKRYFAGEDPGKPAPVRIVDRIERGSKVFVQPMESDYTYVDINFKAPSLESDAYYAFRILCDIINRPASMLHDKLRKDPALGVLSVEIVYEHHRGFSAATLRISSSSSDVERIVSASLEALKETAGKGCTREVLEGVKVSLVTGEIYNEEKYHYYGMLKADGLAIAGADFLVNKISSFQRVTRREVEKAAKEYFNHPDYKVAAIVPSTKEKASERKRTSSTYLTWQTGGDMKFITKYNQDSRVFAVHLLFKNRLACEPGGKNGITEMLSRMLLKGTKARDENALDGALRQIGADLVITDNPYIPYDDYRTKEDYSFVRFQTIDEYYEEGLELLKEIIFAPALPEGQLEQVKSEMMALIAKRDKTPYKHARKIFYQRLFEGHPFQFDVLGDKPEIESITIQDLEAFHARYFSPENIIATVVSNIKPDELRKKLDRLFGDIRPGRPSCDIPPAKPVSGVLEVTSHIEAAQNTIYLGNLLSDVAAADVASLTVMNGVLSKKLGEELREKLGLAYSVGSSLYFGKGYAWQMVYIGTASENLDVARKGLIEVMEAVQGGVSDSEVESFKNSYRGRMLMRRLSRINQAYYMGLNEHRGFGYGFDEVFIRRIKEVSADDVNAVSKIYLPVDSYVIAVAGPLE